MAPQATPVVPTPTVQPSALSSPPPANASHKPFIPVTLLIFLGLCLAYTLSYVLYRIVMARRRESDEDIPDSPDRGVSQFMNGARLTLNLGHPHKATTPLTLSESPNVDVLPSSSNRQMDDEEKPLTDPSHFAHLEVPKSSLTDSSSTPSVTFTPSFAVHPNQEQYPIESQTSAPAPAPAPTQRPFSQRIAAKVKLLSTDRAEAIALDPKLAPVQGPLRPLSMVPSPSRKKRTTLFGLGLKHPRGHVGDPETDSEVR